MRITCTTAHKIKCQNISSTYAISFVYSVLSHSRGLLMATHVEYPYANQSLATRVLTKLSKWIEISWSKKIFL